MKHVSILALPAALATSVTIPLEMLNAAAVITAIRDRTAEGMQIDIAGPTAEALTLTGGITIQPRTGIESISKTDLVFIPALWGNPRAVIRRYPQVIAWLQQQHAQGAIICSVGTGSYFLAEAGLLERKAATTHWYYFDDFQKRYPGIKLQRKRFITHDERLYCTGSVNAARDLMLHFVEQFFDSETANEVSQHFTHELKRSYESLLLAKEQQNTHHDEAIIKVQEWLLDNYHSEIRLAQLATHFDISTRSLNRRFKAAAGKSPLQYLQEVRIEQAKELLKKSNLTIAEIGFSVGYQDTSYFSGLFKRINSVTPNEYRHLVRTKLFNVGS